MNRYYGFDLGDAESAVSRLNRRDAGVPEVLPVREAKSFITAYAQLDSGELLIGESACYDTNAVKRSLRFKSRFLTDPQSEKDVKRFAAGVLGELYADGNLVQNDDCCFYIGCPAGWDRAARERYRRIFEDTGYPPARIVSESRAALISACQSKHFQVGYDIMSKPVLVVDIGSSTTDFAFIHGRPGGGAADRGRGAPGRRHHGRAAAGGIHPPQRGRRRRAPGPGGQPALAELLRIRRPPPEGAVLLRRGLLAGERLPQDHAHPRRRRREADAAHRRGHRRPGAEQGRGPAGTAVLPGGVHGQPAAAASEARRPAAGAAVPHRRRVPPARHPRLVRAGLPRGRHHHRRGAGVLRVPGPGLERPHRRGAAPVPQGGRRS